MDVERSNLVEAVRNYGNVPAEYEALCKSAGVLDLSIRGRLCLTGADRARFLHGQVTNDAKVLRVGDGCYAALITAKGKMESDLNIYCLAEELLLDFESGLSVKISERLEKYIIADDVQIIDIAANYGLLSVQGPKAESVVRGLEIVDELPVKPFGFVRKAETAFGEAFVFNQPRLATSGFDLLVATDATERIKEKLRSAAKTVGGCACGMEAFEIARIEAGIPRFRSEEH